MSSEQLVVGPDAFDCGIQKRLIHAGQSPVQYVDGTKVYFHFKTVIQEDGSVLDDSKKINKLKPMELIIGKKFKLEIWEKAIKTMWLKEVAKFSVEKELLYDYPIAAKQLRESYLKFSGKGCCDHDHHDDDEHHGCDHSHSHSHGHSHNHSHSHSHSHSHNHSHSHSHSCGFNLMEHGLGYPDLDALLKKPKPLDFIFEIVRVEQPGEYTKDPWSLTEQEQIEQIPILKEQGNKLYKEKNYSDASEKYETALAFIDQLMLKEKPNDEPWNKLNEQKNTLLLNYSLCLFNLNEFYKCLQHVNTILETDPTNVKALYRRAKANVAVWNLDEARSDFNKCTYLDQSLSNDVKTQLEHIKKLEINKKKEDMEKYKGKIFSV